MIFALINTDLVLFIEKPDTFLEGTISWAEA
jgi:hypothetical protein